MNNYLIRFFLIITLLSSTLLASEQNKTIRAAIEIGTGGPKLQVAEIDLKTNKIVKMLHTQRYFVNFYDNVSQTDRRLSPEVMKQGIKAFKEAVDKAHSFKVDGIVAIATAAFRSAPNGSEFADEIRQETGIKVHIVDQNLEAKLAFEAVISKMDIAADHLVVWDIGGGSVQFIGKRLDGSFMIDCGNEGVGAFKDFIIEKVQNHNIKQWKTPNPMSSDDIVNANLHARKLAKKVSSSFKDKIKHPATVVVGAGSVFGYGIASRVSGKNPFLIEDLSKVIDDLPGKTDADLGGGDFAFVEGSNMIFTLGYMQELGIKKMHIVNVNNADGAMIYEPFWRNSKMLQAKNYFYDADGVRYELYQTNGGKPFNWLFIPGGPGADSSYFKTLIDLLDLPGNVWLIDLPGNGSNLQQRFSGDFDKWIDLFPGVIKQFENPVLVGHSFGGMFPLLFPELENYLKGFLILNSAPSLWLEEAVAYSKQFDLPDLSKELQEFILNPNQETFEAALDVCMPYYFPKETLEKGRELVAQTSFQYQPAVWWQRKAIELNFSAQWVPQNVPTLIVGSKYDCICPFSLFQKDERFHRPNIEMQYIENAGHFVWVENPSAAKEAFVTLEKRAKIS